MNNTSCNFLWSRGSRPIFLGLMSIAIFALTAKAQFVATLVSNNLSSPYGVATDPVGNVYITDAANERIMEFSPSSGILSTLAGGTLGNNGTNTVIGANAKFYKPQGIVYARGGLVVVDSENQLIRFVNLNGNVSYIARVPNP